MKPIFISDKFEKIYAKYPITLIDIGSSGGFHGRWRKAKGYFKVVGFEPDERAFKKLKSGAGMMYINTALSDSESETDFFLTRKQ